MAGRGSAAKECISSREKTNVVYTLIRRLRSVYMVGKKKIQSFRTRQVDAKGRVRLRWVLCVGGAPRPAGGCQKLTPIFAFASSSPSRGSYYCRAHHSAMRRKQEKALDDASVLSSLCATGR